MAEIYRQQGKEPYILILTLLGVFASMGSVIITPALPRISEFFSITSGEAQQTVSSFLLGYALGQLFYGPFANRFGRLITLHMGLAIAILGTIFSLLASPFESFTLLVLGRFIEAIGCSVGLVIASMMINDYYFPEQAKSRFAILMIGVAIVPGISVMIGGVISEYLNWQACFYFMLVYNVLLSIIAFILPETKKEKELDSLKPLIILDRYRKVLHNKPLLLFAAMVGCSVSLVYIFSTLGPFIGIKNIGLSASTYGLVAMLPNVGLLLGSLALTLIVKKFASEPLLLVYFFLEILGVISLLILFMFHFINIYTFIAPVFFIFAGHAGITAIGMGAAASEVKDKANGTAMINFFIIALPVISTYIASHISSQKPLKLPIVYVIIIIVLGVLVMFAIKKLFAEQK